MAAIVLAFHLDDFFDMRNAFAMTCFDFLSERAAITVGIEDANDTWNTRLDGQRRGSPEASSNPIVAPW